MTEKPGDRRPPVKAEVHHTHRDVSGGWLRPAVFGAMDGLVSNYALMAGVTGGSRAVGGGTTAIVLAGLAGLVAGAFSMAAGEFISVSSQSEAAMAEIETERRELRENPEAELDELTGLWVSRGLTPEVARMVASELSSDPEVALDTHTREEIGVTQAELPSAYVAAFSSFAAFTVGAFLPVVPYLLGAESAIWSFMVAVIGLFGAGALVSTVTTRSWWFSGLRQLILGMAAAGVTFLVGSLVGAGLGAG